MSSRSSSFSDELMDSFTIICIFCVEELNDFSSLLNHMCQDHHFNLSKLAHKFCFDSIDLIRFVNYARKTRPTSEMTVKFFSYLSKSECPWNSEIYLKPTIQTDNLLLLDVEELLEFDQTSVKSLENGKVPDKKKDEQFVDVKTVIEELREKLKLSFILTEKLMSKITLENSFHNYGDPDNFQDSQLATKSSVKKRKNGQLSDRAYFETYSSPDIHRVMIEDKIRTESYFNSIKCNSKLFENSVVLDVGCGSGILSMFAAKNGAKQVYAIEASDIICEAYQIVRDNNLEDRIKLVKGKVEDVDLEVTQVDVIISEWMGYLLLYESMIHSIIYARNKWLKPGGTVFPFKFGVYLQAVCNEKLHFEKFGFWKSAYGFDFSCLTRGVDEQVDVDVMPMETTQCLTNSPSLVKEIIMESAREDDSEIKNAPFSFVISQKASKITALSFSTSPFKAPTHWKQGIFHLRQPISVSQGDILNGEFSLIKTLEDSRCYSVELKLREAVLHYSMD